VAATRNLVGDFETEIRLSRMVGKRFVAALAIVLLTGCGRLNSNIASGSIPETTTPATTKDVEALCGAPQRALVNKKRMKVGFCLVSNMPFLDSQFEELAKFGSLLPGFGLEVSKDRRTIFVEPMSCDTRVELIESLRKLQPWFSVVEVVTSCAG
jgi:hypothetical protein